MITVVWERWARAQHSKSGEREFDYLPDAQDFLRQLRSDPTVVLVGVAHPDGEQGWTRGGDGNWAEDGGQAQLGM